MFLYVCRFSFILNYVFVCLGEAFGSPCSMEKDSTNNFRLSPCSQELIGIRGWEERRESCSHCRLWQHALDGLQRGVFEHP